MEFFQGAPRWIWGAGGRDFNRYLRFRRTFSVAGAAQNARLLISADARYEVWLNGQWIGNGPPRAWPNRWPLDEYQIELREGENVIAARVHQFGVGTFQYLDNAPGLLCELSWRDQNGLQIIESDASWNCQDDARFAARVPRISCQQGWEEQFDARGETGNWTLDFDGFEWPAAQICPTNPHPILEKRTLPFLTQEALAPAKFLGAARVQTADFTWSLQLRALLNADDKTANMLRGRALVATHIWSPVAQTLELHAPHYPIPWKLNGETLIFDAAFPQPTDAGIARVSLREGWNLLLGRLPETAHQWAVVLNGWTQQPVRFSAAATEAETTSPWLFVGPFEAPCADEISGSVVRPHYICAPEFAPGATAEKFAQIWGNGALSPVDLSAIWTQTVPETCVCPTDVFAVCASERIVGDAADIVENPAALCAAETEQWTTIAPSTNGDVRLLLDWGDEVVGPLEWEIEAPAGTILDWHFFEFIQHDGRVNLCEGMNNSLRYVCRAARQNYRTFSRHGFRFAWLSLRDFQTPIVIRGVRALFNTIPQSGRGAFECDDARLNQIWQVGARSVRCCAEDTYTDCPSYEQTHWVGDARNEALVDWVVNGDARLSRHCWLQAARSLERSELVESQVPSAWEIVLPAWSFLWMRWARELWDLTRDQTFARQMLPFLETQAQSIARHRDTRGLFVFAGWNMFDWAPLDTPTDGAVTHLNCLATLGLREVAQMAGELGEVELQSRWLELARSLSHATNRHLWDETRDAYADALHVDGRLSPVFSQQSQTAALVAGVAADHSPARAARCRALVDAVPPGFVEAGSPFFQFFVLEALAAEARGAAMLDLMRSYWGRQLAAGATTWWETYFVPSSLEHGASEINGASLHRLTRSHCHGWSAAPTFFLSSYILGVRGEGDKIVVAPFATDLAWCRGAVPTRFGVVEVSWRNPKGAPFELDVTAPDNVPIEIRLPRAGAARVNGELI